MKTTLFKNGALAALAVLAVLISACKKDESKTDIEKADIVGKWVVRNQAGIEFPNDKNSYHFMGNGKVVMNTWSPLNPDDERSSNGTWKLEDNVIQTIFSSDLGGETIEAGYVWVINSFENDRMIVSMDFLDLESETPYTGDGSDGIKTVLEKTADADKGKDANELSSEGEKRLEKEPAGKGAEPTGGGEKKPEPTPEPDPEPTPEPEPKTDPAPEAAAAGGPISKQVQGYWVMDKDSMIEAMKAEAGKEAGENLDQAAIALMLPMIEMMAEMMAIKIGDGTMSMLSPEGEEKSSFKLLETDDATGKFKILVTKEDGEEEEETPGHIKGDTLTITDDGKSIVMNRIDEEEFNKRQKKIKDFDPTKLFQGLVPEGLEEGLSEGLQIEEAPEPTPVPEP